LSLAIACYRGDDCATQVNGWDHRNLRISSVNCPETLTLCVFDVNTWYILMTDGRRTRGRPPKRNQDRPFQMRVSESFLRMVDVWRRGQLDIPSRAEAIRRMVELVANARKKADTDR
jgi:hypothetical protein